MIITDDEAKWMYGADLNVGSVVEVSGQDIGFTKYSDKKKPQKSNHLMQWYSFVHDPNMIQAFKDYMLNGVRNKFKLAFVFVPNVPAFSPVAINSTPRGV